MDFDYSTEIEKLFHKLETKLDALLRNIDLETEESVLNSLHGDVVWEMGNICDEVVKHVNTDVVDDVVCQMDDLNSMDEAELIEAIKSDKKVFKYIINPSDDVISIYKFIYEL
ncbi:hypothetical protein KAU11_08625 [Candidatus Babeliales bacterium]|nr:hypothetical protein [Candidatus Babeliales bacterium]